MKFIQENAKTDETVPLLEADHIGKQYHSRGRQPFYAVENVSFSLYQGDALGIVGESGSGKSTLAKLIAKLIPATEGKLLYQQKNITKAGGQKLRDYYGDIQMVFQNPVESSDPRRTLGYGIGESLRNRGMKKADVEKRVKELLELCELKAEYASRHPREVSGGECQRAAIARALAVDPKILICDEATSSLDVTVQKQIMELLIRLREEKNLTVLFICHNLALVQMFCDRVIVMQDGRIEEQGTTEQVIWYPKSEYTRNLIDSVLM